VSDKRSKLKLAVERLQPGVFIEVPGKWKAHPFLFNRFRLSNTQQIAILKRCGYEHVYVDPGRSTAKPLSEPASQTHQVAISDEELTKSIELLHQKKEAQIEAMQLYRRSLKKCQDDYMGALAQVRGLSSRLRSRPLESIAQAEEVISSLNDALQQKEELVLHLVSDDRDNSDLHHHSLSVCVLAMLVGKYIGLGDIAMVELGLAGLLHDIGKLKIPKNVYKSKTIGSDQRSHIIRQHPQYGLEVLKLCPTINDNIKLAISQHHEFADGSGYPKRLTRQSLADNSLIISLVNYYEKLRFPYDLETNKEKSPALALSHLFKFHKSRFDPVHLTAFIKTMGVYPPGTFVALSNGQFGIVMSVKASQILTPYVMVFDPNVVRSEAPIIDTSLEDISIDKALTSDKVPQEIQEYLCPIAKTGIYIGI